MAIIIIFTIVIVMLVLFLSYTLQIKKSKKSIDFKSAMDLADLPIITMYNNSNKINFLLDTGSDANFINASDVDRYAYDNTNCVSNAMGIDGSPVPTKIINMEINLNGNIFMDEFRILDLDKSFSSIKHETGVTVNGILGSKFFRKYKYLLDFEQFKAIIK